MRENASGERTSGALTTDGFVSAVKKIAGTQPLVGNVRFGSIPDLSTASWRCCSAACLAGREVDELYKFARKYSWKQQL
jgi:hypothetical protein